MNDQDLVVKVSEMLFSRKADDIVALNVSHLTVLCDYMVLASARSASQVSALAEAVEEVMAGAGVPLRRTDGLQEGRWAVLDYGHIIVHLFHRDERLFYSLDRLWNDGSNVLDLPFDQSSSAD